MTSSLHKDICVRGTGKVQIHVLKQFISVKLFQRSCASLLDLCSGLAVKTCLPLVSIDEDGVYKCVCVYRKGGREIGQRERMK